MFEITAGVLQGDTLAPFLLIIIVDYVYQQQNLKCSPLQGSPSNLYCHQRVQAMICWSLSQSNDRAMTEPIHSVLFWQPAHIKKSVGARLGGQHKTFADRLASDTGPGVGDMKTDMTDRKGWKDFIQAENRQRSTRQGKTRAKEYMPYAVKG